MDDRVRLLTFLTEQKYMTLAVTLDNGLAWAVPVRIKLWDGARVFEWDSMTDTAHSRAIAQRPDIAISIWTPDSDDTVQFGFYGHATAERVATTNGYGRYRAVVTRAFINDASFIKREVILDA